VNQNQKLRSLPTLREKHRYILFKLISQEPVEYSDFEQAIWHTLLELYGESGVSKMSFRLVRNMYDERGQAGVAKCNHASVPQVVAGLGLVSRLGESKVVAKILKVSGTLKGLGK
jgi:ribonuclease P/MRP protein subunit POP5